jgi:hypothetical protein
MVLRGWRMVATGTDSYELLEDLGPGNFYDDAAR